MGEVPEILSRAGIFQGVESTAVNALIEQLESVTFPRGTTIFDEGEPGDRLFIIIDGKVKLGDRVLMKAEDGKLGFTPLPREKESSSAQPAYQSNG